MMTRTYIRSVPHRRSFDGGMPYNCKISREVRRQICETLEMCDSAIAHVARDMLVTWGTCYRMSRMQLQSIMFTPGMYGGVYIYTGLMVQEELQKVPPFFLHFRSANKSLKIAVGRVVDCGSVSICCFFVVILSDQVTTL